MERSSNSTKNTRINSGKKNIVGSKWDMHPDSVVVPKKRSSANTANAQPKRPIRQLKAEAVRAGELELAEFKKKSKSIPAKPENSSAKSDTRKMITKKDFVIEQKKVTYEDEVTMDEPEEFDERSEYRRSVLKKTVIILAVVLVVCILAFLVYQIMRIDSISIEGTDKLSEKYVEEMSGVEKGIHVFVLDEQKIKASVERDPRIEYSSIEYLFPDKLTVVVTEHMPAACFYADGQYVVIDSNGKVLDISEDSSSAAVVEGVNAISFSVGEPVKTDDEVKFGILKEMLKAIEKYGLSQSVRSIDLETTYSIGYMFYTGMNVKIGHDTDIDKKVFLADKVNTRLSEMGKTTGIIDVSYGDQAIYTNPTVHQENANNGNSLNYDLEDFGL